MPHRQPLRPRLRQPKYRLLLERLEDRLPPGDLFWSAAPLSDLSLVTAPTAESEYDQAGLLGNEELTPPTRPFDVSFTPAPEGVITSPVARADTQNLPSSTAAVEWQSLPPPAASGPTGFGAAPVTGGDGLFGAVNSAPPLGVAPIPPDQDGGGTQAIVDMSVANIEVTQAIQTPTNTVGLVADKATLVRVTIGVTGSPTPVPNVTGLLLAYDQFGNLLPGAPFSPSNGPISAKTSPSRGLINDTLNFTLPPVSGIIHLLPIIFSTTAEETNFANNFGFQANLSFNCRQTPTIDYLPIDYRPGSLGLPNPALIAPGAGDDFVRAIYPFPTAGTNYYNQVSGAPLVWTQDINSSTSAFFNALNTRRQMTNPMPDFLYAWLPGNPFSGNGAAQINGRVSFGNTDTTRHIRTFAHELGHNFGLQHNNRTLTPQVGIDVENAIGLGQLKAASLYDIMVGGQFTPSAFVDVTTYNYLNNHALLQCGADEQGGGSDYLFVTGLVDEAGNATLNPTYRLDGANTFTPSDPAGNFVLQIHTAQGELREVRFSAEADSEIHTGPLGAAFALVIPNDPNITRLTLLRDGQTQDQLTRSSNAPVGGFVGLSAVLQGETTLAWEGADPDGDVLTYSVQYSPDGGQTLVAVAVNETGNQFTVDANSLPASPNGLLRLIVTDGLNTTTVDQAVAVESTKA